MPAQAPSRALSVLVVDDDPHLRLLTVVALRLDPALHVRACDSGEAALAELEAETADIVLLDLEMPGIGGRETAQRIVASRGSGAIAVILVTGRHTIDARALGARGVIRKPFDPMVLATEVRRIHDASLPPPARLEGAS